MKFYVIFTADSYACSVPSASVNIHLAKRYCREAGKEDPEDLDAYISGYNEDPEIELTYLQALRLDFLFNEGNKRRIKVPSGFLNDCIFLALEGNRYRYRLDKENAIQKWLERGAPVEVKED